MLVVLFDVGSLPGVADPLVTDSAGSHITTLANHLLGEGALLRLVLVLFTVCQQPLMVEYRTHSSIM